MSAAHGRDRVIEVKRTLDGREQRFECALVHRDASVTVVLFRFKRDGKALRSYGLFWPRRPYSCYYVVADTGGPPRFVRFDVIRDLEFRSDREPPEVRYLDLLLDLWVEGGAVRWEDDDEVEQARRAGRLAAADAARIERARGVLGRGHRRVAAEVRALLARLGEPL